MYSPTFVVGGPSAWNDEYFLAESDIWKDEKLRLWMPWQQLVPHSRRRMLRPETDYSYPILAQVLADIIAAGGYGAQVRYRLRKEPGGERRLGRWYWGALIGPGGARLFEQFNP